MIAIHIGKMDKAKLIEILNEGINNAPGSLEQGGYSHDRHALYLVKGDALCYRNWAYDDWDGNDDSGNARARIPGQEVEEFLDEVLAQGKGERIFASINSWRSNARDSNGMGEDISKDDYGGGAQLTISIEGNIVKYTFLPTPPQPPTMRLSAGKDYLRV